MADTLDLLQVKIENAKRALPEETQGAIAAVDWKGTITSLRARRGYTFEQLGDLELETELLLSGLLSPEDYPKELEKRMKISKEEANRLVNEMNDLVFEKIREEVIKISERRKMLGNKPEPTLMGNLPKRINTINIIKANPAPTQTPMPSTPEKITTSTNEEKLNKDILSKAGIEIVPPTPATEAVIEQKVELPAPEGNPLLEKKMSGSFQIPAAKTEYSLNNISKADETNPASVKKEMPKVDPYREIPE